MLNINLLPAKEKKLVRLEESSRIILFLSFLYGAIFLLGILFLLPTFFTIMVAQNNLQETVKLAEEASTKVGVEDIVSRAKTVASGVSSIRSFISEPVRASTLLRQFLKSSGSGIAVEFLSIKKSGSINIRGKATTRRDLLRFEQTLRERSQFQELSSPLSNIIRETNINFSFEGKLKTQAGL